MSIYGLIKKRVYMIKNIVIFLIKLYNNKKPPVIYAITVILGYVII